jgi:hypothetical protein
MHRSFVCEMIVILDRTVLRKKESKNQIHKKTKDNLTFFQDKEANSMWKLKLFIVWLKDQIS